VRHLPYPRFIYNRAGQAPAAITYCGSLTDGGRPPDSRWPHCDPKRYDVDGPVERLLAAGAEMLLLVDTTVGGVRFSKTHDVLRFARLARDATLRGTGRTVPLLWVNDPTGLLDESYPTNPANWTRSLGPPVADRVVPLAGRGNPVTDDLAYARIVAEGILGAFNPEVPAADTGVLLFNHGVYPGFEVFDPKIDDTVVRDGEPAPGAGGACAGPEARARAGRLDGHRRAGARSSSNATAPCAARTSAMHFSMRSAQRMPAAPWGHRYWEALDQLRAAGARHIVVVFPQVIISASPALVELAESGRQGNRLPHVPSFERASRSPAGPGSATRSPTAGLSRRRVCAASKANSRALRECCYRLGGCGPGQPISRSDANLPWTVRSAPSTPALTFDIPAFGHLGYRAEDGAPDNERPVQSPVPGNLEPVGAAGRRSTARGLSG
jgi:hypothetical protein